MSGPKTIETSDQEAKMGSSPRKVRHRKKQLYENIMKQMEFYFSDANLTKDRFLGDLVKSDPYVPLDTFMKFNKIRSLTQDINHIAKAMKHSTLLELSDDRLKVCRKTPVLPYDADSRTVYVESIPATATRDWLHRIFSDYGHVAYISLPKFKNSQKAKGFAFIEFGKAEDAQKCIQTFTKMGCKLPTCMPPDELSSIKMFSVDEPQEDAIENKKEDYEPPKKKTKRNKDKRLKSLELKSDQESDSDKKNDTPSDENKSILTPTEETKPESGSKDEMTSQDEDNDKTSPRKKKARKRISKDKSKAKLLGKNETDKGALWGLQVLSKSEWKALRNKYLNLQRKYMKELKSNLQNRRHAYSDIPEPAAPVVEDDTTLNPQGSRTEKVVEPLEMIPGVFVKEILPEPVIDVRLTKRTIRSNVHALHVEAKEGSNEVIIRFDSAKAADEYVLSAGSARVLSGAAEAGQWEAAAAARAAPRPRGRQRLALRPQAPRPPQRNPASPQPTHTHIRFDDQ